MTERLYIVVPCYNEEEVLPETAARLGAKMRALVEGGRVAPDSRVCFVNDGSKDGTWGIIRRLHEEDPLFSGVNLSRNRGHQNALLAGLMTVKDRCDVTISMDADLQDDIDAVDAMLEKRAEGFDIVYGVRSDRGTDTAFKRSTALAYYRFLAKLGVESVYNHADYRLMSRRALDGLAEFKEVNLFLRGMVPLVGYPSASVEYVRGERFAGESKYPFSKMFAFAIEGVTSLSVKPIRFITNLGVAIFVVAIIAAICFVVQYFIGVTVPGWASMIVSIWALGGLQLLAIGVIGEYIGKIYLETKARPRYLIQDFLDREG
ncbi:MAG: glycosyltransferase family 2 protein [Clostridiales Family XIII bacterium]|jgi:glycosyltransferase involved in cell wall biosynthesis|nr:glycosyltransferase family 2 protein [Clostridiales Family XIII bacterium]